MINIKKIVAWLKEYWFVVLVLVILVLALFYAMVFPFSTKYIIINIDGCDYIEWRGVNKGKNLLHKANCKNHKEVEYVFKEVF